MSRRFAVVMAVLIYAASSAVVASRHVDVASAAQAASWGLIWK